MGFAKGSTHPTTDDAGGGQNAGDRHNLRGLMFALPGAVMTIFYLISLLSWVFLSFVIAGAADERGRSAFGWWLFSMFFSPLIAGLFLLLFPPISLIDDQALQGSIKAADQITIAVQELRVAIRGGRIDPSRLPPMHDYQTERGSSVVDQAPRGTILAERVTEPPLQKQGFGGVIALIAILVLATALTAWIAVGISNVHNSRLATQSTSAEGDSSITDVAKLAYPKLAASPCVNLLNAYGTVYFSSFSDPIVAFIREKDEGYGSTINIDSYLLTQCRVNESYSIGKVVDGLFELKRQNRLPQIPIGGATSKPQVEADWDAFNKWIHHNGPRPDFGALVKREQKVGANERLIASHRNFVLAFNASICRLRSDHWFGVIRSGWDQYSDNVIRQEGVSYAEANALLQKVRSDIEAEFGKFPEICKVLLNSPILDRLDEIENRMAGNYH
jgi:hypothetical protein